jgi:hypothetical protein
MLLAKTLKALEIPLILTSYGLFIVTIQPILIKASISLPVPNTSIKNILALLFITVVDAGLLYSWYRITKFLRTSKLKDAQSYSGSSYSDRPS